MLRALLLIFFILYGQLAVAQHHFEGSVKDEETQEPLIGVTIYLPGLKMGTTTDIQGYFILNEIPSGKHQIRISYVGFETLNYSVVFPLADTLQNKVILMHHDHEEMEEIVITSTRSSRSIEDIPTRVEFIAGEELAEKGNMKPGDIRMLLNESTGIQTQQTSATSYNSSIRIQGLDGKYTQLLRDGLPLYSGFSGGLSLMQIAPLDLKQVEVIKGASSTLYGGGAIAGLVNLISKTPEEEPELNLMLNGTSALGLDASSFYAQKYGKVGATIFTSFNKGTPYDPADIGLTAIPEFNRFTINPRLFFYLNDRTELNVGVNITTEDRLGGNIDYIEGNAVTNPYFEKNETQRYTTQFHFKYDLADNKKVEFKNSVNLYDRSITIPDFTFSGQQQSTFSELNFSTFNDNMEWTFGANLWTDEFNQSQGSPAQNLDFTQTTGGIFAQNIWNLSESWSLESGFRIDYINEYGYIPLPKFSLMLEPNDELTFRLGGGLGYKTPNVFSEEGERLQFQNINAIDTDLVDIEKSYGGNFDVNYRWAITSDLSLTTNALFYYTQIENPLELALDDTGFSYQQADGYIDSKGVEINMKLAFHDFKLFIGYTFADVEVHENGVSSTFPLVAKHRLNNVLMYEKHDNFWIGLEAYYFSPQQLSDQTTGQSYWIVGLMTEKRLGDRLSLFLNFENFTDTRQSKFDVIFTGSIDSPQFKEIYAPVDGFIINGGVKIKLM